MEATAMSMVSDLASKVMGPLVDYCKDLINLEIKVRKMRSQFDEVDAMKIDVKARLEDERKRASNSLKKLMEDVDKIGERVKDTQKKFEEANKKRCLRACPSFCGGFKVLVKKTNGACPKFWYRFKVLRRVREIEEETNEPNRKLQEQQQSYRSVRSLTLRRSEEDFGSMETFKNKKSDIEQLLVTEEVKFIGVWGTEDVMKTTELTLVHNSSQVRDAFDDFIFWITLSDDTLSDKAVTVRKTIADQLGSNGQLSGDELFTKLCEKKFLLIVDGMSEIDKLKNLLYDVGLPPLGEGKYKMVFSCPSKYVVETVEKAKDIELTELSEEEGWNLFCKKAFGSRSIPIEMEETAQKMVKDCQGLASEIDKLAKQFRSFQDESKPLLYKVRLWRIKFSFLSLGRSGVGKIVGSFLVLAVIIIYFYTTWFSHGRSESSEENRKNKDESSPGKGEKKPPEDQRRSESCKEKREEKHTEIKDESSEEKSEILPEHDGPGTASSR